MTWHEVQRKLLEAQKELQMCIHKAELTELGMNDALTFGSHFFLITHNSLHFKSYRVLVCAFSGTEKYCFSYIMLLQCVLVTHSMYS